MELPVATPLGLFVTEHRARIPQALRTVIENIMLERGTYGGCGTFGAQCQTIAVEMIDEGIHFLLNDVRHFAEGTNE